MTLWYLRLAGAGRAAEDLIFRTISFNYAGSIKEAATQMKSAVSNAVVDHVRIIRDTVSPGSAEEVSQAVAPLTRGCGSKPQSVSHPLHQVCAQPVDTPFIWVVALQSDMLRRSHMLTAV